MTTPGEEVRRLRIELTRLTVDVQRMRRLTAEFEANLDRMSERIDTADLATRTKSTAKTTKPKRSST